MTTTPPNKPGAGRPSRVLEGPSDADLTLRCQEGEKVVWRALARHMGISLSDLVRVLLKGQMHRARRTGWVPPSEEEIAAEIVMIEHNRTQQQAKRREKRARAVDDFAQTK